VPHDDNGYSGHYGADGHAPEAGAYTRPLFGLT
jgi:hypothetical protein